MATLRFCHFSVLSFYASIVIPSNCLGHFSLEKEHKPLFLFGDSFFDAGNNNYINTTKIAQANYWPYGETYFGYPTGRFSDGRQIPDFIAEYANLPLITPYLQPGFNNYVYGVNFASGGAGALKETHQGLVCDPKHLVIDLQTQLSYFKNVEKQLSHKLGYAQAKTLLSSAVYLFSVGSNDFFAPLISEEFSYSQEEYIGMVIGNITHVVKEIYRKGGRKFGFLSLGPIGCHPALLAFRPEKIGICMEELTEEAQIHNKAILKVLHALEIKLKGFRYSYFDFYNSMSERLNNPIKYGFKEGKKACCGSGPYRAINCGGQGPEREYEQCDNPKDYVFFDGGHPTERTNQKFSKLMWSGNSNVTWPYNVQELFGTL